jgi:PKD repeat protein
MAADRTWNFSTLAAPTPAASFTASPTSGTAPLSVQFTDTSTGTPTSWSWDFGDGTTATTQNPAHTYSDAGSYTVSFTATNASGSSPAVTGTVTVAAPPPAPVASFTADQTSGTAPLPVQFTDASTGSPTSWAWNFGDGATATTQNPAHTYTAPGTYTVTLTATNGTGASAPITATIRVTGIKAGSSTTANGANAAVSVPRPAGIVNGDVLIVQVTTEQNPSMSVTPSGWTAIPSTPVTIDAGSRMFAFYHVVTNATAEPASYNWQLSAKLKWGAGMTAFSGANTATPLETAVTTKVNPTATTALTVPGVTTTGSGAMLVGAVGLNAPGITVKSSTGWTVSADNAGTQRAVLAYRYLANPGASGDLTWALSKSATSGGWLVALHAAA